MKDKIKNIGNKIKKVLLMAIILAFYGLLFIGVITIGIRFCAFVFSIAIVIGLPTMLVINIVKIIKQEIESHKLRKEMLNDLQKHYQKQQEYATERVENIQKVKNQNGNILYVEGFVPCDDEMIEVIKKSIEKYKKNSFNRANALEIMDSYELVKYKVAITTNKEELLKLKQQLALLSFQLQDIASRYNTFLKNKTLEEMYDSRDTLIRLRRNANIVSKE